MIKDIQIQNDLKKLDETEKYWLNNIEEEEKQEKEITEIVDNVTAAIMLNGKTRAIVNETQYAIASKVITAPTTYRDENGDIKECEGRQVVLVISNIALFNLAGNKYTPSIVRSDYDERYNAKANIRAAVEGWVRHITGTIKPENLDN